MEVILLRDVPNLGEAGSIVKVRDGYGRNYLIPRGYAVQATAGNRKALEHQKRVVAQHLAREKEGCLEFAKRIEATPITIEVEVGEQNKLYGSVTARDIEEAAQKKGMEIERRRIALEEPIRSVGEYAVPIKLHPEVVAKILVSVVPKESSQAPGK